MTDLRLGLGGLLLLAACAGAPSRGASFDAAAGASLPSVSLAPLAPGPAVDLAELRGRVVLLDFWATWCEPCRDSLPVYDAWQRELGGRGFAVVAVSVDEGGAPVGEVAAELAPAVQVLLDPGGEAAKALQLDGLPVSFLVGRDGVVRSRHVGFDRADAPALRAEIEELLGEGAR